MVGKVIDTCQSRLLSWSISSSQLLQTAKEAAAPRTCLNHPNGCPVPGSAAALSQPVIEAAAQPLALTQASSGVAVPAEPQASNSAVQTQPPPNAAAAAQPVAAGQSAQPVAPAAAAPVTRTEHLQARDARQKQLDVQYLALQAQQAQDEASQKGRLTKQQGVASTTKDEGELA